MILDRDLSNEEIVTQAASRIVKTTHRITTGRGTDKDQLLMRAGETVLKTILPSLSRRDIHRLAKIVVDISSWSIRHMLEMPLPSQAEAALPENRKLPLEKVPKKIKHVFDDQGKGYPLEPLVIEMLRQRGPLRPIQLLHAIESKGLKYSTTSKNILGSFRDVVKHFPSVGRVRLKKGTRIKFKALKSFSART